MSYAQYELACLASCLEGFLFGIYSGIFAAYLKYAAIRREAENTKRNIIFYAIYLLYLFTMAVFATDIAAPLGDIITVGYRVYITGSVLFGCCDFITQAILIHRCWIVWGCNMHIVIIPSFLAFAYLVIWAAGIGATVIEQGVPVTKFWGDRLALTSLTASMTVNALVTGLIVFRILKVFQEVRSATTSEDRSFGITHENKPLRSTIFVIIESGMPLLAIQLARVVISVIGLFTDAANEPLQFIIAIHEILNGIAPTIILVRVSLRSSFHDKQSLAEAVGTLQFAVDNPNQIPGTGSMDQEGSLHIGHDDPNPLSDMNQERRLGDDESGGSDDIQMVETREMNLENRKMASYTGDDIIRKVGGID